MRVFLMGFLVLASFSLFSQSIATSGAMVFHYKNEAVEGDQYSKRGYFVGPHVLGDTITMLLDKFERDYVYYRPGQGAYSTEEKVVLKPVIYRSIQKIERYYDKGVRQGSISPVTAYTDFKNVLEVALKLRRYDTGKFEQILKKQKKPDDLVTELLKVKFGPIASN